VRVQGVLFFRHLTRKNLRKPPPEVLKIKQLIRYELRNLSQRLPKFPIQTHPVTISYPPKEQEPPDFFVRERAKYPLALEHVPFFGHIFL